MLVTEVTESPDLLAEVTALRARVDDLAVTTGALLRSSDPHRKVEIVEALMADRVSLEIFMRSDGMTSQAEILFALANSGIDGGTRSSVSRKIEHLREEWGLIVADSTKGKSKVYRHTQLARDYKIQRELRSRLRQ